MNQLPQFTLSRNSLRRFFYVLLAFGLLLALMSGIFQQNTSAAIISTRSIQMSNATPGATGVTYNFTVNLPNNTRSLLINFCRDSPILASSSNTCIVPTAAPSNNIPGSMSTTGASLASGLTGWSAGGSFTNNGSIQLTNATAVSGSQSFTISGITNPSCGTGTVPNCQYYAKIIAYTTQQTIGSFTGFTYNAAPTSLVEPSPSSVDWGGIALTVSTAFTVNATVQEVLTFCVDGATTAAAVACPTPTSPNLTLGTGTPPVIGVSGPFTGSVFSHLQTNANGGVAINLKTTGANATCAGLYNSANTSNCAIPGVGATANALTTSPTAPTTGSFGMRAVQLSDGTGATGTLSSTSPYNGANYAMQNAVYGTYGDTVSSSTGAAYYKNTQYVFAAVSAAGVPAGNYTNSYSLIATGTF